MKQKKQQTEPNILIKLADLLGTEVKNRRLDIPEKFGKGYCTGFIFDEHIRMLISNYELNEDIAVKNPEPDTFKRMIFFKFQNIFPKIENNLVRERIEKTPSVLIATSRVNTDDIISIHTNTATINVEVDTDYLNRLFDSSEKSPILQSLLQNTQPLLFEQMIYPSIQKIVNEIVTERVDETFKLFFLRIKAEELICRLLIELEKRDEKHIYALNCQDIQAIYRTKERVLEHLETPPVIKELANYANMSSSKLQRLFKQIFGSTIFNYYQNFRIKEAARLLKEEKISVSETGYQLGFTNLSHFSRVFQEHIGIKPKQYTKS
ncbi:Regulatory protein PchR [termite gut metagenome]|uniref:Regulatory protein PchR n=2 Tax=termite gut metagenome TaxID=433724 RepID=A0A5J4RR54_9ZZZZ